MPKKSIKKSIKKGILKINKKKSVIQSRSSSNSFEWADLNSIRRVNALGVLCSDSDLCMAIGKSYKKILKFFNNFSTFEYVVGNIHRIGADSSNGMVYRINYEKIAYNAYAILKVSISNRSDNLM